MPFWLWLLVGGGTLYLLTRPRGAGAVATPNYVGMLPGAGLNNVENFVVNGLARVVWTYVPTTLGQQPPLLFVFHESDGGGIGAIKEAGVQILADANGIVVIAPEARVLSSGDWDNHVAGQKYWETHPNVSPTTNPDLQLILALIAEAQKAYGCDPKRVYTMGFSSGAFFSLFTAMTLPDQIAAFTEYSGGLVTCPTTGACSSVNPGVDCNTLAQQCACIGEEKPTAIRVSGRKSPGYLTHAADDDTVPAYYTCALATRMQQLGYASSVNIRSSGGHTWPQNIAQSAWEFMRQYTL